jgi:hypothetical protein
MFRVTLYTVFYICGTFSYILNKQQKLLLRKQISEEDIYMKFKDITRIQKMLY